ncbi:MAG: hypothetical protein QM731_24355 [Chitinophagaceae bacterium]
MAIHPFDPQISSVTKKLLIGTLPPETANFYFSNSSNTRLWDILKSLSENSDNIGIGANNFNRDRKKEILDNLRIGICDIIYKYDRKIEKSTKDVHIIPKEYKDLLQLAIDNNINELLFVYQSAYKWFMHSLRKVEPVRIVRLKDKYTIGLQPAIMFKGERIKCVLLPSPLNRGTKGQTLQFKLSFYKKFILD